MTVPNTDPLDLTQDPDAEGVPPVELRDDHPLNEETPSEPAADPEPVIDPDPAKEPAAPAYEPNYSYSVGNKEFEFDDRLRDIIKDKDSEDYIRDLVTKAEGLDKYKTRLAERDASLDEFRGKFETAETGRTQLEKGFERLNQLSQSDFSSFAKAWGISDKAILDHARAILQDEENPQHAHARQQQFDSVLQGWQHEDQQAKAQQQMSTDSNRLHEMEMELAFNNPEVIEFQSAYDRAKGQDGAFRTLVSTFGSAQWNTGNQLRPRDCVKAVMEEFGAFVKPTQPQVTPQAEPQAQPQRTVSPPETKQALPNLGSGKAGSPVKQRMSWAEMKKLI